MRRPPLLCAVILAASMAAPAPCLAAWLRCAASGTMEGGAREFLTTIAEVGPLPPARLQTFQTKLSDYARRAEPGLAGIQSKCFAFDDQIEAAAAADHVLESEARRLGWDHLTVVLPSDWLPASESGRDIYHP